MVVLQPLKPGALRGLALKRGRARRALSLLGKNDAKVNLQVAESLMTISAEEFANKWDFDPVREVPLGRGRFHWMPLAALRAEATSHVPSDLSRDPRTCGCAPEAAAKAEAQSQVALEERTRQQPRPEEDSGVESDESVLQSSPSSSSSSSSSPSSPTSSPKSESQPRLRQTCITEFVRPKKRLTFPSKEHPAPHPPPPQSKKRSASSLQEHLQPPHKKVLLQLRA